MVLTFLLTSILGVCIGLFIVLGLRRSKSGQVKVELPHELREPPKELEIDSKVDPDTEENLAYGHVPHRHPKTQENVAYGHVPHPHLETQENIAYGHIS